MTRDLLSVRSPLLRSVENPGFLVRPARWILASFVVAAIALAFVPWQQTSPGDGEVTAFAPAEREQEVHAPVKGRIERWAVVEGERVERGQLLVEIVDVDPGYLQRLERGRAAVESRIDAAEAQAQAYEAKAAALVEARLRHLEAQDLKIEAARQKRDAASQALAAAEAAEKAAILNEERRRGLVGEGLVSRRDVELAEMSASKARADVNEKRAKVAEARAEVRAAEAERMRKASDDQAKIASAEADARKARADLAKAKEELVKAEVSLARQGAQRVTAPVAGSVLWVKGHLGGNIVKAGESLVRIVPDASELSVELWVDGNDAPLIHPGQKVRVQIEGWPAVQVAGWPEVAVGTFGGEVAFVDARSRRSGRFRVFVKPDPADVAWPEEGVLRQGARAKGWVLLRQVPLGFELWRQINGFPVGLAPGGELDLSKAKKPAEDIE